MASHLYSDLVQNAVEINLGTLNMRKIISPSKFYNSKKYMKKNGGEAKVSLFRRPNFIWLSVRRLLRNR